nr:MAG TPA: hypothetical protein [Caudoviricetes sp.]
MRFDHCLDSLLSLIKSPIIDIVHLLCNNYSTSVPKKQHFQRKFSPRKQKCKFTVPHKKQILFCYCFLGTYVI